MRTGEEAELGVSQERAEKQSEELLFLSFRPTTHLFLQSREVWGQATQRLLEQVPEGTVEPWTWSEQGRDGAGFAGAERKEKKVGIQEIQAHGL